MLAPVWTILQDPSTGIAPLVYPLPASTDAVPPAVKVIVTPFKWLLGFVRTLLVVLLILAHWLLVELLMTTLRIVPPLHSILTRILSALICRTVLFLLGLAWISTETVSLRRTGRSPPSVPFTPRAGDLIVANSSSYVDVLYLAFRYALYPPRAYSYSHCDTILTPMNLNVRYNPYFLLPCSSLGSKASSSSPSLITSYRVVSLTTALLSSGKLPERSERGMTLEEAVSNTNRPLVWFPEATTSNNRALLKLGELVPPKTTGGATKAFRLFLLSFNTKPKSHTSSRYPLPTRLVPSATYPIPDSTPLPHLFSLTSTPFTTTLHIRRLHPSESPSLSSTPRKEEMEVLAEMLASTGRWKRVKAIDWEMKDGFLKLKSSSVGGIGKAKKR
ncbi:BZ3500_MvSof-1268-A1-R1_Chr1-3g02407 [Microbotryum saponariae]|uniref:BZ3500_MvSof-1268-A1-R1_Chr1-3g02407 protein n=1 Tax=Microbotryum saponariae TaxID=289078 RepID=A0A2X0MG56_9BASI|nr:BZ3500_MvSof-1268-A1-R1_Chr1-3g02407 [Microbotryum saponariae]SCZ96194.1 BZ3501_MvSof-1269-A2-R1_Chr1-3g02010 [Microbotryum saponariae]